MNTLGAEEAIRGGRRNLLDHPGIGAVIRSAPVASLVSSFLSHRAFCVRGILFDKTKERNWNLPFHQDTKIAIRAVGEAPGYGQFSEKDGVMHCCPPAEILERQIAVRIHLDECPPESGPVRVIPGSDQHGILDQEEISEIVSTREIVACIGGLGSVLVFRSLVLHGSDRSTLKRRRRVLHLEFCDAELAAPLEWNWRL